MSNVECACLGGEDGLVVGGLLDKGHDIVHVLGGGQAALLPLVVHPHVLPGKVEKIDKWYGRYQPFKDLGRIIYRYR